MTRIPNHHYSENTIDFHLTLDRIWHISYNCYYLDQLVQKYRLSYCFDICFHNRRFRTNNPQNWMLVQVFHKSFAQLFEIPDRTRIIKLLCDMTHLIRLIVHVYEPLKKLSFDHSKLHHLLLMLYEYTRSYKNMKSLW